MFKSGFVTIVGKPNSGKSTLLNTIIGNKISIVTNKSNTTRNQIKGIYNSDDSQIIFIDTPGFLRVKNRLDQNMQKRITDSINGVDVILYLLPFWKELDKEYLKSINLIKNKNIKRYLILTKTDKTKNKEEILLSLSKFGDNDLFDKIIPISSYRNKNIDLLISEIKKDLTNDIAFYEKDKSYEFSDKFYVAEIIREKALFNLKEEIPHDLYVYIDEFKEEDNSIYIRAEIVINRENIKGIIIGKNGDTLKTIGTKAREELEGYFGKNVFLETFVKVKKDWKNKDYLIENI